MDFECKLSYAEMREAFELNQTTRGRVGWVLRNLRVILALAVVVVVIAANLSGGSRNWGAAAGLAAVAVLLIAVAVWSARFRIKHMAKRINGACVRMSLDGNGMGAEDPTGRWTFATWSDFHGWREGTLVFTVGDAKAFRTIPKSAMSENQVGEVRGILQSQIR